MALTQATFGSVWRFRRRRGDSGRGGERDWERRGEGWGLGERERERERKAVRDLEGGITGEREGGGSGKWKPENMKKKKHTHTHTIE